MTRDDIIAMAREAGLPIFDAAAVAHDPAEQAMADIVTKVWHDSAERFAALVAAHEREMCAGLCGWRTGVRPVDAAIETCAAAIRARGETE